MKPSYTDFDRVKCIASTENQKQLSEMAHMYAASAAIKKPIRSYYPPQAHPELSSEPFTRTIVGRGAKQSNPAGCIMWTSMCIPQTLNSFSPNHFVPLVKKNESTSSIVVC